jgi:hypothetical protein
MCETRGCLMRIYFDVCAFNRPFDDQKHIRVRLEAEAKLYVQGKIKVGEVELVWSYMLDLENDQNPFRERRLAIEQWRKYSITYITESDDIIDKANEFVIIRIETERCIACIISNRRKSQVFHDNRRQVAYETCSRIANCSHQSYKFSGNN